MQRGGGGNLSLSLSSLFFYLSLSSLTDILTWLTISSHAYIYVSRYTYIIYMYMYVNYFANFSHGWCGVLSWWSEFFSLKFDNSCDFDCPDSRSGRHFFFIFQVVIRRGHDEVMDSQSEFHFLSSCYVSVDFVAGYERPCLIEREGIW